LKVHRGKILRRTDFAAVRVSLRAPIHDFGPTGNRKPLRRECRCFGAPAAFSFACEAAGAMSIRCSLHPLTFHEGHDDASPGHFFAAGKRSYAFVIAGLDPAIHHWKSCLRRLMDTRVKPAYDGFSSLRSQ
jgi:hypothetical protein